MSFIKKILDKITDLIYFFISFDKNDMQIYFSIFNFKNHFFIRWREDIKEYKKYTIFKIHKNFGEIELSFSKSLYTGICLHTALVEDNGLGVGGRFYFSILGLRLFSVIFIKFLHILYLILLILLGYGIYWSYITYV